MEGFVFALDLVGTFAFALCGAMVGVRHRLDVFGVLVLAFAAGNAGGLLRDVLIGAVPPAALSGPSYIVVSLAAGLLAFVASPPIRRLRDPVLLLDAVGLAVFAVAGTLKSLAFGLDPLAAILLGTLTGIGGGMVRDVLVGEVPTVLRAELYAVAALAAATIVVAGRLLDLPSAPVVALGAGACFGLRVAALRRGWALPKAPAIDRD
jgi:uncharacterized membrane protein YeiH